MHYINEVLADLDKLSSDSDEYSFVDHAKHWSELKGFALGLQFNPRSRLALADFKQLHVHIGDAPVIEGSTLLAMDNLVQARTLLMTTYGFDAANTGDNAGAGGW